VARVEAVLGEEVGLGDLALAPRESVEDLPVRHGAARDGLDVAEIGAGETQADRGVGAESVARFQDHETAPGAHEGGSGAQQLLQRVRECGGARQALGQFVQSGEIRDPTCESVLENGPGGVGEVVDEVPGAGGAGATVCAGDGTVESIPATFGR
jgi:hypothetical protein